MTFYAGYSEANRIPTPLELGCSNPLKPCLLEGFLVSDPPLQQVVARTREGGLRGNINTAGGRGDWKLGLFRIDSQNDIIQVASVLQGRGVFQNVPATRRQGLEAGAQYQTGQYLVYANYALIDATYQFSGKLASPNNPFADADGNIFVVPGKQIPGIPRHQIKGGVAAPVAIWSLEKLCASWAAAGALMTKHARAIANATCFMPGTSMFPRCPPARTSHSDILPRPKTRQGRTAMTRCVTMQRSAFTPARVRRSRPIRLAAPCP
jgi:hypothetical protein